MEPHPSTTVLHIFFKGFALCSITWRSIQADDDAVFLQLLIRIISQRGGDIHEPSLAIGKLVKELDGLLVELHMGFLGMWFVMEECFEAWCTGIVGGVLAIVLSKSERAEHGNRHQQKGLDTELHVISFLYYIRDEKNYNLTFMCKRTSKRAT